MGEKYILAEGEPVEEPDLLKWAKWFEKADRHVDKTMIGDVRVSTVFLGIDHRFGGEGDPLLFETMVFGGPLDQEMDRYSTREQAKAGHLAMCERVRNGSTGDSK